MTKHINQMVSVLSSRGAGDVRSHFHRSNKGGGWVLRGTEHRASDSDLCSLIEWFASAKRDRWND